MPQTIMHIKCPFCEYPLSNTVPAGASTKQVFIYFNCDGCNAVYEITMTPAKQGKQDFLSKKRKQGNLKWQ